MDNKNILNELDSLLEDYQDLEKKVYEQVKTKLKLGITYRINNLVLSDKKEGFVPLNLIKPFFKLFHKSNHAYYRAKYKKRPVLTSLRNNLDLMSLFLDDLVEFSIIQNQQIIFKKTGLICDLLNEEKLNLQDVKSELSFNLVLLKDENREVMERELDSIKFLNDQLFQNSSITKNVFFSKSSKEKINLWFAKQLNVKKFDLENLTLEHLKLISTDVLVLNKVITNLKFGKLNLEETKDIVKYKAKLIEIIEQLAESEIIFEDNQVVLNYVFGGR